MVASPSAEPGAPIVLGWRALEVLAAVVALDAAALAVPVTEAVVARAVQRPTRDVGPVLSELEHMNLLECMAPARTGARPTWLIAEGAAERLGISRIGDLLVLAAALLTGTSQSSHRLFGATRHMASSSRTRAESDED